jgi:exopolyphosphatase / guanosine-5'-triphosphate,3'-diphosphate pyrophosphatase
MTGLLRRLHLLALLLVWSAIEASEPPSLTLAAFDIGSGTTRMLVADVAPCSGEIIQVRDRASVRMPYASDLARSELKEFSPELIGRANAVMAGLMERVRDHHPEAMLAVATEAFRNAGNAETLLEQWQRQHGLTVRILGQNEEAHLAWRLVAQRSSHPERLLVWDIGAGSQQLVWRDSDDRWQHFNSDLASVTLRNRAMETLKRPAGQLSPNPLDRTEAERLAAAIRDWLDPTQIARVAEYVDEGAHIIGVGGVHGISLLNQLGLDSGQTLTRAAIADQLERQLGRNDEQIGGSYADTEVVNLILVGTLMDLFGITRYQTLPVNLTEALMLDYVADCGR